MNSEPFGENYTFSNYSDNISAYQEVETPKIQYYDISFNKKLNETISQAQKDLYNEINFKNNELTKEQTNLIKTKADTYSANIEYPPFRIINVVSMFSVDCPLNLETIGKKCINAEYNPKKLNAVIMRIKEPKTVALIFYTGKIICTGAKNEQDSKKAAIIYAKILKKIGYPVKFKNFRIINIVSTCDTKFNISLTKLNAEIAYISTKLSNNHSKFKAYYEPEDFPGLIFRLLKPEMTLLIFASGKVNFVGVKDRNDIPEALEKVYPLLKKFKIEKVNQDNSNHEKQREKEQEEFNYI